VIAGLLALGVSSFAFGMVDTIVLLDSARFVQGVAGALIWAGALTWLLATAPPEKRGSVIGTALGTAVAGVLLGPALGAVAASVGTEFVFGSVLVVSIVFSYIATRFPDVEVTERQTMREVGAALTSRPLLDAAVFVAVPSVLFGAVEVLVPLRIDDLGGGHGLIAAGFIGGAAIEATLAPLSGRASDRVGRRRPYVAGLLVCAVAMMGVGLAGALAGVIMALLLVSVGAGLCFAPAMTLISDTAAIGNLHQGFAAGLSNMAWASGQVIGGVGGGAVATLAGNVAPSAMIAALLLGTVFYALRALPGPPLPDRAAG
jgi:MFS family permease